MRTDVRTQTKQKKKKKKNFYFPNHEGKQKMRFVANCIKNKEKGKRNYCLC